MSRSFRPLFMRPICAIAIKCCQDIHLDYRADISSEVCPMPSEDHVLHHWRALTTANIEASCCFGSAQGYRPRRERELLMGHCEKSILASTTLMESHLNTPHIASGENLTRVLPIITERFRHTQSGAWCIAESRWFRPLSATHHMLHKQLRR